MTQAPPDSQAALPNTRPFDQADQHKLELHEAAAQAAGEAILWIDPTGHFAYFNRRACESLGYEADELAQLKVSDINPYVPEEEWSERWQQLAQAEELTFETFHRRKDGTTFPVEVSSIHLAFQGQEYACTWVRDISQRRQAQRQLRESESRYRTLTEISPVGIFHTDALGQCRFVNNQWCEIAGLTLEEAQGEGWSRALHPEDRELVFTEWQAAAESQRSFRLEYRFQQPDGTVRWVIGMAEAERDEEGEVTGYVGTVTDVTTLRKTSLHLKSIVEATSHATGAAFFRSLVEHLATTFEVRWALIGELRDRKVVTHAVWDRDQVVPNLDYPLPGSPCANVIINRATCFHGDHLAELFPEDPLIAEMGARSYLGYPMVDRLGRVLGLVALLDEVPMTEDPENTRLLDVFTVRAAAELERLRFEEERRSLEAQVQHTQKLESLGVLAGGIAHDFNNLLGGILGNASLALRRIETEDDLHPLLIDIANAAERCAELANQMLAYSGKGRFVNEDIELGHMVLEMVDLLRLSISKKARLQFGLAEDLPVISCDPTQIRQVVMNLITNASDALGGDPGNIVLRTGLVELAPDELHDLALAENLAPGQHVFLEVSDTGCGMDEVTQSRLFDPFFTTKFTGRGLGMAAVLGIVRSHRGGIRVDSTPGEGTHFRLYFPPETKKRRAAPPPIAPPTTTAPSPNPWQGSGTVLVVDDEEIVRLLAAGILEEAGFQVETCTNGLVALERFRELSEEVVAVLLDMTMPELDGLETLEGLRRIRDSVPVILSSGYSEQAALDPQNRPGVAAFIKKPYRPMQLLEALHRVLNNAEGAPPGKSQSKL